MALPRTYPRPAGVGVTDGVYVHDQLKRVEKALEALRSMPMTLEEQERLERALTRAHQHNIERLQARMAAEL